MANSNACILELKVARDTNDSPQRLRLSIHATKIVHENTLEEFWLDGLTSFILSRFLWQAKRMTSSRKGFSRWLKLGKAGKVDATAETALSGSTEAAASSGTTTTGTASPGQKSGLYSTEGSIGIKVVAEPDAPVLEYVPSLRL